MLGRSPRIRHVGCTRFGRVSCSAAEEKVWILWMPLVGLTAGLGAVLVVALYHLVSDRRAPVVLSR